MPVAGARGEEYGRLRGAERHMHHVAHLQAEARGGALRAKGQAHQQRAGAGGDGGVGVGVSAGRGSATAGGAHALSAVDKGLVRAPQPLPRRLGEVRAEEGAAERQQRRRDRILAFPISGARHGGARASTLLLRSGGRRLAKAGAAHGCECLSPGCSLPRREGW